MRTIKRETRRVFLVVSLIGLGLVFGSGLPHSVIAQESHSLKELPRGVKTSRGKAGITVDWGEAGTGNPVMVRVWNRTNQAVTLDRGPAGIEYFLAIEFLDDEGKWRRYFPHRPEMCGTGFYEVELEPGEFMEVDIGGRQNSQAESRKVRVRAYSPGFREFSNEGTMMIDLSFAEEATRDDWSIQFAELDELREMLLGDSKPEPIRSFLADLDPIPVAIYALTQPYHDSEQAMAILEAVVALDNEYSEMAREIVRQLNER